MSRALARSDAALVAANLAGPVAWTAHLLAGYALVSIDCGSPWQIPDPVFHVLSAALALVALAGVAAGALAWRDPPEDHPRRRRWMSATAMLFSGTFLLGIVFGELPAVFLRGCS